MQDKGEERENSSLQERLSGRAVSEKVENGGKVVS